MTRNDLDGRISPSVQHTSLRFETINAAEIWLRQGGLIQSNDSWLLVNLHPAKNISKLKNIRFPYQVMANDVNQSLPVQFRSFKNAREFFMGEMAHDKFQGLIADNKARMFHGKAK